VCGGIQAAAILTQTKPDIIILDHDLPMGNGSDLIDWLAHVRVIKDGKEEKIAAPPIITASGIPENNTHMKAKCDELGLECHHFQKHEVYSDRADNVIREILNRAKPGEEQP
jgi:CheY-like chemotaxis protein